MNIREKLKIFRLKFVQTSRLRFLFFSFLGLIILVIIFEGFYYFYLKKLDSKEITNELPDSSKPSTILGEDLAITPAENYQECEEGKLCHLDASIGVRELPGGTIGIGGYFVGLTTNSLTVKIKEKEVEVAFDAKTVWHKIDTRLLNEQGLKNEYLSFDDLKVGDRLDVICQQTEKGLKAVGVLAIY
jgi:hypothetical protein